MSHKISRQIIAEANALETANIREMRVRVKRLFAALEEALELEVPSSFATFSPSADIVEKKERVEVYLELPGIGKDEIDVYISPECITIEGKKLHQSRAEGKSKYLRCERLFGEFKREIKLHWTINIKGSSAELSDGILRIAMPKLADRRGSTIKIPVKES